MMGDVHDGGRCQVKQVALSATPLYSARPVAMHQRLSRRGMVRGIVRSLIFQEDGDRAAVLPRHAAR